MKTNYLLPHAWKKIGMALLILVILFYLFFLIAGPEAFSWGDAVTKQMMTDLRSNGSVNTFTMLVGFTFNDPLGVASQSLLTLSLALLSLSKEKIEDEYITAVRSDSFVWSLAIVTGIFICLILLTRLNIIYVNYSLFWMVNLIYVLFLAKFHLALRKLRKSARHEE